MFKPFNQKLEELGLSEHLENIKLTPPPITDEALRLPFGPLHLLFSKLRLVTINSHFVLSDTEKVMKSTTCLVL